MNKDMSKNLKDIQESTQKDMPSVPTPYKAGGLSSGSYTKIHKLITALYMVTDIMDKDEPIRNKLRILGIEIMSDPERSRQGGTYGAGMSMRIDQIVSFLNIAGAMNFISEMNCAILKKEFLEFRASVQESIDVKPKWLEEFFENSPLEEYSDPRSEGGGKGLSTPSFGHPSRGELIPKGHQGHTRLGVQKGSTLMEAIKDMSNRVLAPHETKDFRSGFDMLKKERRQEITSFIIKNGGNATITDIKNGAKGSLTSCSEKTLQRELMSMTKDGVLNKTGEKRWTKYSLIAS